MTVNTATSTATYTGNGATTAFAIPFYFLVNTDLQVLQKVAATGVVKTLVLNSDYTLTGAGVGAGGSLTMTVAPATGDTLYIARNVAAVQQTAYPSNSPFPAASHEQALDRLTMLVQQLQTGQNLALYRSPLSPVYDLQGNTLINEAVAVNPSDVPNYQQIQTMVAAAAGGVLPGTIALTANRASVSVLAFGADPTGVADSTAAFAEAFLDPCRRVHAPAGTYALGACTVPSGVTLFGAGEKTNIVPLNATAGNVLQFAASAVDATIRDIGFTMSQVTYAAKVGVYGTMNARCNVANLTFIGGGRLPVLLDNSTECVVSGIRCTDAANGIVQFTGTNTRSSIRDCIGQMPSGTLAGFEIMGGFLCDISRCSQVEAGVFGFHLVGCTDSVIRDCISYNTTHESINLQDCNNCVADGNTGVWDGATSVDFGMSMYAATIATSNNMFSNNTVVKPGSSGYVLDGSLHPVVGCSVIGNKSVDCNQNSVTNGSGVLLYGSGVTGTTVSNNMLYDDSAKMQYGVNAGGTSTLTTIKGNAVSGATVAKVARDTGTQSLNGVGSVAWTPTVTAGTGTLTTVAVNWAVYYELEKMIWISFKATITTNGTGAQDIRVTLPSNFSGNQFSLSGHEGATSGKMLQANPNGLGTAMVITNYDSTYPAVNGSVIQVSGWYERV